ncbi:hypothetical protein BJY16_007580 [Actinoplanes octamycinicus]|uniref:Uncharacterized protein n=1 Tax=Actinoplanes octamycinicus TaxID=135948 RepID=A0A7W7MBK4_9ACTN|nr:hypothetical protein [Actinoplanes octamycinicus]MBB4744121.1 hypothetical protein [Actinoplanes octamycinicus]GIE56924.1 hypothetical protein Aoc01nite_23260 [Actinoplanes octamycinicus]
MSVLTDYFAAGSDGVAATAVDYVDGQPGLLDLTAEDVAAGKALYRLSPDEAARPRVQTAQSGTPVVLSKSVDPTSLGRLEAILTGRSYDEVNADPRRAGLIAPARHEDIEGCIVLSVTDTLRDALASLEPSTQPEVARQWASAEFDATAENSLMMFLAALTDLARRAVVDNDRLYCLVTF